MQSTLTAENSLFPSSFKKVLCQANYLKFIKSIMFHIGIILNNSSGSQTPEPGGDNSCKASNFSEHSIAFWRGDIAYVYTSLHK